MSCAVGTLQVNTATRVVTGPNGTQHLTPKQCELLSYLMRRPNQVFSRRQLMKDVWQTPYVEDTRTLDVHMRWLREKRSELDPERPALFGHRARGGRHACQCPELEPEAEDIGDPEAEGSRTTSARANHNRRHKGRR